MVVFDFRLVPLDQLEPWGEPGSQRLHWFGLTDGEYWIEVGQDMLFEYTEAARQKVGCPRYCAYQVVRLYEDLLEIVSDVLAPVPTDISPYLILDRRTAWSRAFDAWAADAEVRLPKNEFWDSVDAATSWIAKRTLDSGYLAPSARIQLWADDRNVYVEWNNRDKLIDGVQAWTATSGSYAISRATFVDEVQSFHDRLMNQMNDRVGAIRSGRFQPAVDIDIEALAKEHEQRAKPITRHLAPPNEQDWSTVRRVIDEIKKYGFVPGDA